MNEEVSNEINQSQIRFFLGRLDDWDTIDIIREILPILNQESGSIELCSDPYEDMDIQIGYPFFYIDDNKVPLKNMLSYLLEHLQLINPKSIDYKEEILSFDSRSFRIQLLDFLS
jgi:hypothetical protein